MSRSPPGEVTSARCRASPKWDRFTLEFADGGRLALFDKRRLGRVRLNPDISLLGPDAEEVTPEQFRQVFSKGTIAVKARLLDQSKLAGIGNLLADEALWQARISPAAPVSSLRPADVDRLYRAVAGGAEVRRPPRRGAHRRDHPVPARRAPGARATARR